MLYINRRGCGVFTAICYKLSIQQRHSLNRRGLLVWFYVPKVHLLDGTEVSAEAKVLAECAKGKPPSSELVRSTAKVERDADEAQEPRIATGAELRKTDGIL